VLAGILGVFAGLLALPMLFFGVFGIVHSVLYSKKKYREEDMAWAGFYLLFGLFCAFVCIRWLRVRIRRLR
jgi:hypothetical protein